MKNATIERMNEAREAKQSAIIRQATGGPHDAFVGHGSREEGGVYWQVSVQVVRHKNAPGTWWRAQAVATVELRSCSDSQHQRISPQGMAGRWMITPTQDSPLEALATLKTMMETAEVDEFPARYAAEMVERQLNLVERQEGRAK